MVNAVHQHIGEYIQGCGEAGTLHHAYLFVGSDEKQKSFFVQKCIEACSGSSPVIIEASIDAVRAAIRELSQSAPDGSVRSYLVADASRLNQESANALLKILEEPPRGVMFFFLARTRRSVMQTIVSRCQVVRVPSLPTEGHHEEVDRMYAFLTSSLVSQLTAGHIPESEFSYLEQAILRMARMAGDPNSLRQASRYAAGYAAMKRALGRHMKEQKASDYFLLSSRV